MTYTSEKIMQALLASKDSKGTATLLVSLLPGDVAWNPASTSQDIYGPATLRYRRWADGGVDVNVNRLD